MSTATVQTTVSRLGNLYYVTPMGRVAEGVRSVFCKFVLRTRRIHLRRAAK
jgi:hypothetical protein